FGSHGNLSGKPPFAAEQSVLLAAQWIATPSKSAKALRSIVGGEPAPKMVVRSTPVFSISISAAATPATSQPARVKGTHGAGAFTRCRWFASTGPLSRL